MTRKIFTKFANPVFVVLFGFALLYLSLCFFPYNDDLAFADWILNREISFVDVITVYGVNGRYLGNLLGVYFSALGMTSFWWVRSLFHFGVLFSLFLTFSKLLKVLFEKLSSLSCSLLSSFFLFTLSAYAWNQLYGSTACLANYVCPMIIIFMLAQLYIKYLKGLPVPHLNVWIPFFSFLVCFFVEHITIYTFVCAVALLVLSYIRKLPSHKTEWLSVFASFIGTILMFSHILLRKIDPGFAEYRSFPPLSELPQFIATTIYENCSWLLWANWIFCIFLSGIACLSLICAWKKKFWLPSCLSLLIFAFGAIRSFFGCFGSWNGTPFAFILSNGFSVVLLFLYLLALAYTFLILPEPLTKKIPFIWCFLSILFCGAMLSVVSPIGYRCFFIHFTCFFVIATQLFCFICTKIPRKFSYLLYIGIALILLLYLLYVGLLYTDTAYIHRDRITYIEEQIVNGATKIIIPSNGTFTDWNAASLSYFYSVEIVVVDHDTWLSVIANS